MSASTDIIGSPETLECRHRLAVLSSPYTLDITELTKPVKSSLCVLEDCHSTTQFSAGSSRIFFARSQLHLTPGRGNFREIYYVDPESVNKYKDTAREEHAKHGLWI